MQREITINEFENTINVVDKIDEPIVIKRNNKEDLVVISLEQYKKNLFFTEINSKIEKGEEDLKNGRVHSAKSVFKELRKKYGY